jgi:hypothetical protein
MKPQPGEQFSPSVASQALHNLRSVPTSALKGNCRNTTLPSLKRWPDTNKEFLRIGTVEERVNFRRDGLWLRGRIQAAYEMQRAVEQQTRRPRIEM